jgi:hypothetical protein
MRTRLRMVVSLVVVALAASLVVGPAFAGTTADTTVARATLTGAKEVPGPGDPNGTGWANIRLTPDRERVCFTLYWSKIRRPFAAHIHRGTADRSGPVRLTLFESRLPLPGTFDMVRGCVRNVDAPLIQRMIDNPHRFYVNVHNRVYPAGAIRGQLTITP